jgi:hypothetical protein
MPASMRILPGPLCQLKRDNSMDPWRLRVTGYTRAFQRFGNLGRCHFTVLTLLIFPHRQRQTANLKALGPTLHDIALLAPGFRSYR